MDVRADQHSFNLMSSPSPCTCSTKSVTARTAGAAHSNKLVELNSHNFNAESREITVALDHVDPEDLVFEFDCVFDHESGYEVVSHLQQKEKARRRNAEECSDNEDETDEDKDDWEQLSRDPRVLEQGPLLHVMLTVRRRSDRVAVLKGDAYLFQRNLIGRDMWELCDAQSGDLECFQTALFDDLMHLRKEVCGTFSRQDTRTGDVAYILDVGSSQRDIDNRPVHPQEVERKLCREAVRMYREYFATSARLIVLTPNPWRIGSFHNEESVRDFKARTRLFEQEYRAEGFRRMGTTGFFGCVPNDRSHACWDTTAKDLEKKNKNW